MCAKNTYDNQAIQSLKGAERVRYNPGNILGSNGLEGCEHTFFEILSNSIDEARAGFGKVIEVTRFADHSIQVKDYGRGIPLDYNEKEERYNWELVFCELYAGGKYHGNDSDTYKYSLGLNGLGACATQYSSEYMDVEVCRDNYIYSLHFEKGENVGGLLKIETNSKKTYTIQKWRPDLEVFTDINIPLEFFTETLKRQAIVNAGLTFILFDESNEGTQKYEFCYPEGIKGHAAELAGENAETEIRFIEAERSGRDRADKPEYKVRMEAAFCFTPTDPMIEFYHNSSFLEYGGVHDSATKTALVYAIDQYIRQSNKYQKNESKISFNDIADCLILIISSFSTIASYEHQTKKAVTNAFIKEALTDFLKHNLEVYFIENRAEADKIAERVLLNKRSRETAERTRVNLKSKKVSSSLEVTSKVKKFIDCRTKDVSRRELFIVEGDSALGSCKLARDPSFQAIMPIRGKILNCLKADFDKIFKSDIILDLIRIMGCGIEAKTKLNKEFSDFDINALNYSKIIICTDADYDGFQIRTLVLTMIYTLTPSLIEEGKVFIAETPLFEINTKEKKSRTFFAYDENEKNEILAPLDAEGIKYTIQRSKGLGENEAEMMWLTTMCPESRRLIKVMPSDAKETAEMFELFLGSNLDGRKDYIAENGNQYMDMLDIS